MSRLFELRFSVSAGEVNGRGFGESVCVPQTFCTLVGGLSLEWHLVIYPAGLRFADKTRVDGLAFSVRLATPALRGCAIWVHVQPQLANADGRFPHISCRRFVLAEDVVVGGVACFPGNQPIYFGPDGLLRGRLLMCIDASVVEPASIVQFRINSVPKERLGHVVRRLYEAGLAGNETLCDTRIVCNNGTFRAASCILRLQSNYFVKLFEFKEKAGKKELEVVMDKYSVDVVSALLHHLHLFAPPDMGNLETEELETVLDLADQINPRGIGIIKGEVEKILLRRIPEAAAELGVLARLAELHGLAVLANVVAVRLAAKPLHFHKQLGEQLDDKIWTQVALVSENAINGIHYELPEEECY